MINRNIPKYLCLCCNTWQEHYPTNDYKLNKNAITHLYCYTCKKWIAVESTSLFTGERYIIKNLKYNSIIDNDCFYPKIIFQGLNIESLKRVCQKFNELSKYSFSEACEDYNKYINELK